MFLRNKKAAPSMLSPGNWITKAIDKEHANVLQIGSNDGKTRDPLFKIMKERNHWKGFFVEPVPYLFERLKNNYLTLGRSERFQFSNSAVNEGTEEYFYYVDKHAKYVIPNLPEWYDQIGSFNRDHILEHMEGKFEPFIKKVKIRGIKLSDLISQFNINQIDLLHLDTEGYDWLILSQLDLKRYQPTVILYEHKHLNDKDYDHSLKYLSALYDVFQFKNDCLCLHREKHEMTASEIANLSGITQVI
jgi:FkbM family methyltransferase